MVVPNPSGSFFAIIFGAVSPKISTKMVMHAVDITAATFSLTSPVSESNIMNSCVDRVDEARLTRLFPIRMLPSMRS